MQHFLLQAAENEKYLLETENHAPDGRYDWKTTIIFYTALHWMKAFLWSYAGEKNIGSHEQIRAKYYEKKHMMPRHIYNAYDTLFRYSCNSRYNGISPDVNTWNEIRKDEYAKAKQLLEIFRTYMRQRGLPIIDVRNKPENP